MVKKEVKLEGSEKMLWSTKELMVLGLDFGGKAPYLGHISCNIWETPGYCGRKT